MGPYSLICGALNCQKVAILSLISSFPAVTLGVSPVPAPHCTTEAFTPLVLFISTAEFLKHLM